jgi:hypothetical protein
MAEPLAIRTDVRGFQALIGAGEIRAGDAVLYCYGRQNPLSWAIRRVQVRALRDLLRQPQSPEEIAARAAQGEEGDRTDRSDRTDLLVGTGACWTHAGMVVDAGISAEMTSPRARLITWEKRLQVGDRLLVVRPQSASEKQMQFATENMEKLVDHRTRYPWRELLTYWFSTLPAAIAAPHFAEHFLDHRRDVCSGAIWKAWWDEGAVEADGGDSMPESWYPGRMAIDTKYLHRVAEVTIVEDGKGDADED